MTKTAEEKRGKGKFRVGDSVRLDTTGRPWLGPDQGTVSRVTTKKVLVCFPVRKFVWLHKWEVKRA